MVNTQIEQKERIGGTRSVNVVIRGIRPLLFNNLYSQKTDGREDKSPEFFAKETLYVNTKGEIFTPAVHLEKALAYGGKEIKYENRSKYKAQISSFVSVEPAELVHKHQKWEAFSNTVCINKKNRIPRHRAMLKKWELAFTIVVENNKLQLDKLQAALEQAGQYCGIGDWRVEKGGKFGTFEVVKFEPVQ